MRYQYLRMTAKEVRKYDYFHDIAVIDYVLKVSQSNENLPLREILKPGTKPRNLKRTTNFEQKKRRKKVRFGSVITYHH